MGTDDKQKPWLSTTGESRESSGASQGSGLSSLALLFTLGRFLGALYTLRGRGQWFRTGTKLPGNRLPGATILAPPLMALCDLTEHL